VMSWSRLTSANTCCTRCDSRTSAAANPYEEVWRAGATRSFVGLRTDLTKVSEERVQELIEHAWRNTAHKRVVAAYDAP
jgi:hypothetical protein